MHHRHKRTLLPEISTLLKTDDMRVRLAATIVRETSILRMMGFPSEGSAPNASVVPTSLNRAPHPLAKMIREGIQLEPPD